MRHVVNVKLKGSWNGASVASVTLAFNDRHRRRIRMYDDSGDLFLLNLSDAMLLAEGDGLELDNGNIIAVRAAPEPVADIYCKNAMHLARIAWHIGNRHTAIQLLDDSSLRISDDSVLVNMVEGLSAKVKRHSAPFQPEPGAYSQNMQVSGHERSD